MAKVSLSSLKPKIAKVAIKHPVSGEETKLIFHMCLPDASIEFRNRIKKLVEKNEQDEQEIAETLAPLVVGWEDNDAIDEAYSAQGVLDILLAPENRFMVEQLYECVNQKHLFYEGQKKRSSPLLQMASGHDHRTAEQVGTASSSTAQDQQAD